jgi:hypothetical protein
MDFATLVWSNIKEGTTVSEAAEASMSPVLSGMRKSLLNKKRDLLYLSVTISSPAPPQHFCARWFATVGELTARSLSEPDLYARQQRRFGFHMDSVDR